MAVTIGNNMNKGILKNGIEILATRD